MEFTDALITGGSGMVGSNIDFGHKPTSLEMNVTNNNSIKKYISKLKKISCIIHLTALNLRDSEIDIVKSINLNINSTSKMLKIAMDLDIPFILLSSGAVFSDDNPFMKFDENYITCPNCFYGTSKVASEEIALLYNKAIIIRTGWLFGGNQKTHYKFVEQVINNLLVNSEVKASNNFFGSPTYVLDVIEQMKFLIINFKYGIHHVVNSEIACEYDIALEIQKILKINKNLIKSVSSDMVPNAGPKRSSSEILETIYSFNKLRSWKESLNEYVSIYYNKLNYNKIEEYLPNTITKKWYNRDKCRLCNNFNLKIFLKLEPTPPANHFVSEPIQQENIPLDVCICENCNHIQLIQIVDTSYQYLNYFYVSY